MTRANLLTLPFCVLLAAGCASSEVKPYGVPGSAVKPIGSGNIVYFNGQFEGQKRSGQYIFDFDYDELQGHDITDNQYIAQYLAPRKLMPPECSNGIEVLRHGRGENGKAWLIFKCQ
ncbi:MAG: hypothetical protein HYU77_15975 [Betaproteobacteria bacterium]|nr:hypothetical protein [Betaproteobacteria bacterium]